ncbi:MAG: cytochrome-c peroxidase [Bacteroidia bacterium]|jgi:cytochrome c peroxidase|nr:cytochrome-c peroxidase [Bacteroidia bacterium]
MKYYIGVILCVCCIAIHMAFTNDKSTEQLPITLAEQQYTLDYNSFINQLQTFEYVLNDTVISSMHQQYVILRNAYKKIEWLLDYIDPIFVKEYVNGAPLPKIDKSAPSLSIINPKGLQVIDELMGEEQLAIDEIKQQVVLLKTVFHQYKRTEKLYDRIIFDAMRVACVRLVSMGITGFDLPAGNTALPECKTTLSSMALYLKFYENNASKAAKNDYKNTVSLLNKSLQFIKPDVDFETFNRAIWIRNYINPLFAQLLVLKNKLGIETIYESTPTHIRFAFNYEATSIFSAQLLSADYYFNIPTDVNKTALINLGMTLFYDPILSINLNRSCAGCHQPEKGFTDGLPKSLASDSGTVSRNSPTLLNAVYAERFFHDLRAEGLDDQLEHVFASNQEFNIDILELMKRLHSSADYVNLFKAAYGKNALINKQQITLAIASYVYSLTGINSSFDKYMRCETSSMSNDAIDGFNLFMGKASCGTCHFAPIFNGTVPPHFVESESEVLGVTSNTDWNNPVLDNDPGRMSGRLKEGAEIYRHSFKTPTVRNITLTAPYMHNGAFATLQHVLTFYNRGGGAGLGLLVPNQTLSSDALNLTELEMNKIIAFMEQLTDSSGLTGRPVSLPLFENKDWNNRPVGGNY